MFCTKEISESPCHTSELIFFYKPARNQCGWGRGGVGWDRV